MPITADVLQVTFKQDRRKKNHFLWLCFVHLCMPQCVRPTWPCHSLNWKHNPAGQWNRLLGLVGLWLSPGPTEGKGETHTHIFSLHWPSTPSTCGNCGRTTSVAYNGFCVKLVCWCKRTSKLLSVFFLMIIAQRKKNDPVKNISLRKKRASLLWI